MRKLIIILLVLLAAAGVWAFGQQAENAGLSDAKTRLVKDDSGREISIPMNPQRVIALNSSNIDLYYGAGGKVIARPAKVTLSEEVTAQVKDLPSIGESAAPSAEKIVALKPDLVLGLNMPFHQSLVPSLEQAGIPVLLQSLGNYQDVLKRLDFYGQLSGRPDKAKETIGTLEKKLSQVLEKNKNNQKPKVLLLFGTPESYNMALPESFSGNLLELLGGDNIAAGQKGTSEKLPYLAFNMEFVVKANPEVILLIMHGDAAEGGKMGEKLAQNTSWQGIKAVKDGKVHVLPYHLFGINPGVQVGESIEYLGNLLYGEEVKKNERTGG